MGHIHMQQAFKIRPRGVSKFEVESGWGSASVLQVYLRISDRHHVNQYLVAVLI
jgi:hypothetical protein